MRDKQKPITEKATIFEQAAEDKTAARRLLDGMKDTQREVVKVEHSVGGRMLTYETTPERLPRLLKRLNKTGKTKIL